MSHDARLYAQRTLPRNAQRTISAKKSTSSPYPCHVNSKAGLRTEGVGLLMCVVIGALYFGFDQSIFSGCFFFTFFFFNRQHGSHFPRLYWRPVSRQLGQAVGLAFRVHGEPVSASGHFILFPLQIEPYRPVDCATVVSSPTVVHRSISLRVWA